MRKLFIVALIFVSSVALPADMKPAGAASSNTGDYCSQVLRAPFNAISEIRGTALARKNHAGDMLIAVDTRADSENGAAVAQRLYRVAPESADRNGLAPLLTWLGQEAAEVEILELRTEGVFELHVRPVDRMDMVWVAGVDRMGCGLRTPRYPQADSVFVVPALGIGKFVPENPGRTLTDLLLEFEHRALVPDQEKSSPLDLGPQALFCIAGGPGAVACSWDTGGISPTEGGGCSVECVPQYGYACCGPELPNCECKEYGGGGGGGLPPSLPPRGPCGSECDDDEDPTSTSP